MDRYENLLGEMASLSQGVEESIGSYGARVEKLLAHFRRHLHHLGGANQVAGIEGLVLKGFIAGMKPQIWEMVKYEGANTFSRALDIAIRWEESMEDSHHKVVDSNIEMGIQDSRPKGFQSL